MAKYKEPEFTVTDKRRHYDEEGEAAESASESVVPEPATETATATEAQPASGYVDQQFTSDPAAPAPPPEPPSKAEQEAQHEDYQASNQKLDKMLRDRAGDKAPPEGKSFEMSFERLIASLYMTAMMQLGLMAPEGEQPHADILGARQTIDTMSLLSDKTKGNLTPAEQNMLQNVLFETRMAYLQLTNAITQAPPPGSGITK